MKIRTQDGNGIYEFGSVWIGRHQHGSVICSRSFGESTAAILGVYEDESRARGVLQDIDAYYQKGKKIFYMPET